MKRSVLILYVFLMIFYFCACSGISANTPSQSTQVNVDEQYKKITAEEAKTIMDENDEAVILDVRTQSEFDESHIKGAILIPNETIVDKMPEQLPDLDAEILIYCRSGNRSHQAALKLIELGYTNVSDFGGIIDWPYETVSELDQ